jgi:hypothetical protein
MVNDAHNVPIAIGILGGGLGEFDSCGLQQGHLSPKQRGLSRTIVVVGKV